MRKKVLTLLAVFGALLLTGCGNQPTPNLTTSKIGTTYNSRDYFRIKPKGEFYVKENLMLKKKADLTSNKDKLYVGFVGSTNMVPKAKDQKSVIKGMFYDVAKAAKKLGYNYIEFKVPDISKKMIASVKELEDTINENRLKMRPNNYSFMMNLYKKQPVELFAISVNEILKIFKRYEFKSDICIRDITVSYTKQRPMKTEVLDKF